MNRLLPHLSFYFTKLRTKIQMRNLIDVSLGIVGSVGAILLTTDVGLLEATAISLLIRTGFLALRSGTVVTLRRLNRQHVGKLNMIPPGGYLIRFSEFLFTKKFCEWICMPIISDMREEYFEALDQNRILKARWIRIRGTYSFFASIGLDRAFAFVSFFVKAWKSVS